MGGAKSCRICRQGMGEAKADKSWRQGGSSTDWRYDKVPNRTRQSII